MPLEQSGEDVGRQRGATLWTTVNNIKAPNEVCVALHLLMANLCAHVKPNALVIATRARLNKALPLALEAQYRTVLCVALT